MAKKNSNTNTQKRRRQEKVLEHLHESGNISYACKRSGISRETYYKWREERPFSVAADEAIRRGKESVNDLAHNQLVRKISEGHFPATKFQLERCHTDYQPVKARDAEANKVPPVTAINIHPATTENIKAQMSEEQYRHILASKQEKEREAKKKQVDTTNKSKKSHDKETSGADADKKGVPEKGQ